MKNRGSWRGTFVVVLPLWPSSSTSSSRRGPRWQWISVGVSWRQSDLVSLMPLRYLRERDARGDGVRWANHVEGITADPIGAKPGCRRGRTQCKAKSVPRP